jgi:hypothetical protein
MRNGGCTGERAAPIDGIPRDDADSLDNSLDLPNVCAGNEHRYCGEEVRMCFRQHGAGARRRQLRIERELQRRHVGADAIAVAIEALGTGKCVAHAGTRILKAICS